MGVVADGLRLEVNALDFVLLGLYFGTVLGIGLIVRTTVRTSEDFFLSGRSLPAWITGLAFVSANLGATEILGMAANGAQYGAMTVHYYWVGAVPAMVFLGIVMMPFYYRSEVHSVPEFLRRRFNNETQLLNAVTFAVAQVLIAGIGTAFIAAAYSNIMNYMQSLFSFFNAPLFATFIVGLFWRRMTPWAGFWGLLLGTLAAMTSYVLYKAGVLAFGTDLNASFWGAGIAFVVDVLVSVAVTFRTTPKPEHELYGLVHGVRPAGFRDDSLAGDKAWYRSPTPLGLGALALGIALYLPLT